MYNFLKKVIVTISYLITMTYSNWIIPHELNQWTNTIKVIAFKSNPSNNIKNKINNNNLYLQTTTSSNNNNSINNNNLNAPANIMIEKILISKPRGSFLFTP